MFLGNQLGPQDPRRERVYRNFERNLDDIVQSGLGAGAKILLNTVAVNLRDCPPFSSLTIADLHAAYVAEYTNLFGGAVRLESAGELATAAVKFSAAAKLAPQCAELQYRWAECLLALSNPFRSTRAHFQAACDDDTLPFRADSGINGIIRKTARQFAGDRLALCDAPVELATNLPAGICGQETFFEHVHFNFEGNYRLGRVWADQVASMLPPAIARTARAGAWASPETCGQRLALTDWNRYAAAELMVAWLQRPPLSNQPNNDQRLQSLRQQETELRRQFNADTMQRAAAICQSAIEQSPQDPMLRENFADFLELAGDLKSAAAQWQPVQALLPRNCESFYQAGRLLSEINQPDAAETALTTAVRLRPRLADGWYELGGVHLAAKKFEDALQDFTRARELDPQNAAYCAYSGRALSKLNRSAEAEQLYRRAIELQPGLWEAHYGLGNELEAAGQLAGAENEYHQAAQLNPDTAMIHLARGSILVRLGQPDEARQEFQETLRLQPDNQQAAQALAELARSKPQAR